MFLKHSTIAPAWIRSLISAAESASRAIPPAFPLDATVAVNPFLGQVDEDLATAAARLARVAGVRVTQDRGDYAKAISDGVVTDDDLAAALLASNSPLKPTDLALLKARVPLASPMPIALPTIADLASVVNGNNWTGIIARALGLWASGYFDRGQALWTPAPGQGAYTAWREWATHDLTPEIAGLTGFCAHVAAAPDSPERAILRASEALGLTEASAETAFHRLLIDLGGWAQHARWLLWTAELEGRTDQTLTDLLAIRLVWEEAILAAVPDIATSWAEVVAAHAAPICPTPDQVVDAILQDAAERAHQRSLSAKLDAASAKPSAAKVSARPQMQAAFCIDVRSEVFRRALEAIDPQIATIGFAGFFGLPLSHVDAGSVLPESHLPVLLRPGMESTSQGTAAIEDEIRVTARASRAWGRFRQAAVSSFAFVESAGPIYGAKLVKDALGASCSKKLSASVPRLTSLLSVDQRAATAASILGAMSFRDGFAPLVVLLGHGAQVTNNPHESAYHCGACGGHSGEVSARLLAGLLNDHEVRTALLTHGIEIPLDTAFIAGLHDTTTDEITLYEDMPFPNHHKQIEQARTWFALAGVAARSERALRLPGATSATLAARAHNWAEVRPEWGLAGCAAFIAGPRSITAGLDLNGRAFLHSYDWRADADFGTLELIMTAPVVVASWISLQYYGSTVAPAVFGGGDKLIHNVTGGIGVVEGNGGTLRTGLPWQAVHDGTSKVHTPLRLTVLIDAPRDAILDVLEKHPSVRSLFDNGWLHLFRLEDSRVVSRYRPRLVWEELRCNDANGRTTAVEAITKTVVRV